MYRYLLLLIFYLFTSCSRPYTGFDTYQADQFVIDSYQIQNGKFSILEMQGKSVSPIKPEMLEEYEDLISEDDILNITVYHHSRQDLCQAISSISQSMGFRVVEKEIQLPDIGSVAVEGLSLEKARKKIKERYLKEINDIEVFLSYKKRLKQKVDLIGLVGTPSIPVYGKTRLFDILSQAKIPNQANLFMSYVVRKSHPISVDMYKLIHQGDMSQNIVMQEGDKIYIADAEASSIMITGEVLKPRVLPLSKGFISLRDALAASGGVDHNTADTGFIQVIRGNITKPKIYTLNMKQIIHLRNDSLLLIPGDTVYVASKPIAEWNRFISLLFPSLGGIQKMNAAYRAYQNLAH